MPKKQDLVVGHLENISGDVLALYPDVIRSLIRGKAGIYALYRFNSLYYVGLAGNLMGRLKTHLKDRHKNKWNRFSVYLTLHDEHMKELESLVLRIADPRGNKVKGKFNNSEKMSLQLRTLIKESDAIRQARMLGGKARKKASSPTAKVKNSQKRGALAGVFPRTIPLRGWYKGYEYRAQLRKDGTIIFDGSGYDTPSAAARVALGRAAPGWWFWHFKNDKGDWVRLRTLKD